MTSRAEQVGLVAVLSGLIAAAAPAAAQQTPSMPSTLRYGSGLLDIPVSSVLPHLQIQGTYSGFFVDIDRRALVDADGVTTGYGPGVNEYYSDLSLAIGLMDRVETGVTLQALGGAADGGDVWGLFGRVRLWEPIDQGLGLAAGARYLTSPQFEDGRGYVPGRLGFGDDRLTDDAPGGTNLTLYGVATAYLRGFDGGPLPRNDLTFSLGYGGGMFREGGNLDFYGPGHANGWFYGTSLLIDTSESTLLTLMAEHNGFDVNVGVQFDWEGLRVGAHWLASNHGSPQGGYGSEYQKPKLGLLASFEICPTRPGLRCRPRNMRRTQPDTIIIPPPPPDTVVVDLGAARPTPEGEPVTLCLSTGRNVQVNVTSAGDTLVAGGAVPVDSLRPVMDFAGDYASGRFWFESGDPIVFEDQPFGRAPDEFPLDCDQVLRVGAFEGVPVFADRAAVRPLVIIFVPVRPGVWRRYERGLP